MKAISEADQSLVRVLYVDDYAMDRALVRDALMADGGFQLVEAASQKEFERELAKGGFDVVLSDFNIMGFEGLDVLAAVLKKYPGIPVIIVTGTGSEEVAVSALKQGAADYVIKTHRHIRRLPDTIRIVQEIYRLRAERLQKQEELEKNHSILLAVLNGTPDAISFKDPEGRFVMLNDATAQQFGKSVKQIIGKTSADLHDSETARSLEEIDRRVLNTGKLETFERTTTNQAGQKKVLLTTKVCCRDEGGALIGLVTIARDVTERNRAVEDLRQRDAELAHVARVSTMGEMAAELAHELGQPLHAIHTFAEASQRVAASNFPESQEQLTQWMRQISEQSNRAGKILHRINRFIRKIAPHFSTVDLNELIQEVVELFKMKAREQRVRIRLELDEPPPHLLADEILIEQVLVNLLHNGIEAMRESQSDERRLTIQSHLIDRQTVEVSVIDQGVGLSKENQQHIFEPFFTTKTDGVGIGLAICRKTITSHGGKIWATPNAERGTTFSFTLPVNSAESE